MQQTDTTGAGATPTGAQRVVEATQQEASQVASAASSGMQEVMGETRRQARNILDDTRGEIDREAGDLVNRLADGLQRTGQQAVALVDGRPEEGGRLQEYLQDAAGRLQDVADDLRAKGPEGIVRDVKSFAQRRPGVFLMGAAVAGFLTGRVIRSASQAGDGQAGSTGGGSNSSTREPRGVEVQQPAGGATFSADEFVIGEVTGPAYNG